MSRPENSIITGEVRLSYLNVFTPKSIEGSEPTYSVSLIIPKSDTKTIKAINHAIEVAKQAGISKFGGKIPANLKLPLRDGDVDREDDENYKDSYFMNANCKTPPGLIYKNGAKIEDSTDLYSGCYGRVSITLYPFNTNGNKGIACGLNNIMKTRDGEPLGGRAKAEDDFADYIEEDDDDWL